MLNARIILVSVCLLWSFLGVAESVYEWGHWQDDIQSARAEIERGVDPSLVTPAPAGGIAGASIRFNFSINPDNPNLSPEGLPRINNRNSSPSASSGSNTSASTSAIDSGTKPNTPILGKGIVPAKP